MRVRVVSLLSARVVLVLDLVRYGFTFYLLEHPDDARVGLERSALLQDRGDSGVSRPMGDSPATARYARAGREV